MDEYYGYAVSVQNEIIEFHFFFSLPALLFVSIYIFDTLIIMHENFA